MTSFAAASEYPATGPIEAVAAEALRPIKSIVPVTIELAAAVMAILFIIIPRYLK